MSNQDQKARTLEALERRFVVAKAELFNKQQQQSQKSKKRDRHEDQKRNLDLDSSSSIASSDVSLVTSLNTHKKGNFSFSGYNRSQDTEANDPIYSKLLHPIHESLIKTNVEISGKSMVEKVLHKLFQSGDSAQKYKQGSRGTKIDNWILLDNFVQWRGASCSAPIKALQSHTKRSKHHMSMKMRKKCGSFKLPPELVKFENFKPMHEIWKDYVTQLLKNVGKNQLAQCLLSADLHGATILVADCKNSAFTGVNGIMIRETAETFGIITEENKFRELIAGKLHRMETNLLQEV